MGNSTTLKDSVTHILGIMIVASFVALTFKHLWNYDKNGVEASKAVATALGGMVTLILGYYFGSAAGEKQAEASRVEKEAVRVTAKTTLTDVDKLNTDLVKSREEIKSLKENLKLIIEDK